MAVHLHLTGISFRRGFHAGGGDQGDDLVPLLQIDFALQIVADLGHVAHEHAAGTGDGILLLAALGYDAHDHFADLLLVAAACFFNLSE